MLTSEQLRSIMPRLPAAKSPEYVPALFAAMSEFAIDPPARAAAFLAQLAHESGQLRFMEEIWGPTAAQQRYEPASTLAAALGNTDSGDGLRFKGRGPIQITGRANYRRFGNLLGIDLVATPARAASPDVAFRIAALFWSKKGLNELADQATADAFREITRRINGGFNGLADREQLYATARQALGVAAPPVTRGGPMPPSAPEPAFERGYEAVRAATPVRGARKAASSKAAPKKRARATAQKQRPTRTAATAKKKKKKRATRSTGRKKASKR